MNVQELFELAKSLRKDTTSTGISAASSNLNFYFLEPTAKSIYPVFYPLLASIPRVEPMFNGQRVGGPAVNWKAIVGVGNGGYPAISEGHRNAQMTFTERDYASNYKYIGQDAQVTFQAEFTGLGFEDNIGLAQISLLNQVLNDEERMILYGNSGTAAGGNGFLLGTANTPVLADAGVTTGAALTNNNFYKCAVVALTGWGVTLAGSTGVKLPFTRTNADGSQDTINGGTSAISALSNEIQITVATHALSATTAAIKGAMGYAWYLSTNATTGLESLATAYFVSVTSGPLITFLTNSINTNQAGNATNINVDNSANALDFDGETTWSFGQGGYWKDLGGANLTANGDGTILEWETVLDTLWTNFKLTVDRIWLGGTLIDAVTKKITGVGLGTSSPAVTRIQFQYDAAGRLIGGTNSVAYRSKYGAQGGQAKQLEVLTHPWLPQGVVFFELINNPYPAAGNAIPAVRRIVTLEDHFSIRWPYTTLQHQLGVYAFVTMQHYIPFGMGILTGVGNA